MGSAAFASGANAVTGVNRMFDLLRGVVIWRRTIGSTAVRGRGSDAVLVRPSTARLQSATCRFVGRRLLRVDPSAFMTRWVDCRRTTGSTALASAAIDGRSYDDQARVRRIRPQTDYSEVRRRVAHENRIATG